MSDDEKKISRRFLMQGSAAAALAWAAPRTAASQHAGQTPPILDDSYIFYCPELIEITEPGPIVHPDGTSQCGWSRQPILDLNFEDARFYPVPYFQRFRLKKWDMYHIITPTHYLSLLVAWIGYGAFASALVYDRASRTALSDIRIRLPRPELEMMRNPTAGRSAYESKKFKMVFEVEGERRRLLVDFPGFAKVGLRAELELIHPLDHDSISGVHLTNPRRAHYGCKINCMKSKGEFSLAGKTYQLDPENCFGMLDFGRGYYPPKLFWYWAVSSGTDAQGKLVGFNLGHGNGPLGTAENAVFYDGRLQKIGVVRCQAPVEDIMEPWKVFTDDLGLDLVFTPQKLQRNNLKIGALYVNGWTTLGLFNGRLTLASGEVIPIKDLFGLYEWVDQKW